MGHQRWLAYGLSCSRREGGPGVQELETRHGGSVIEDIDFQGREERASLRGAGPAALGRRREVLGIYGPLDQASM